MFSLPHHLCNPHRAFIVIVLVVSVICSSYAQDLIHRTIIDAEPYPVRQALSFNQTLNKEKKLSTVSVFQLSPSVEEKAYAPEGALFFDIEADYLKIGALSELKFRVPVTKSKSFELIFEEFNVYSKDFKIEMASGMEVKPSLDTKFYRGYIGDDLSSTAVMSVSSQGIQIVISDAWGNYNFGRIKNRKEYVLYNDAKLEGPSFTCESNEQVIGSKEGDKILLPNEVPKTINTKSSGNCIKVHLEVDYRSYQSLGSTVAQVETYINGFFPNVIHIYSRDTIPMELGSVLIWDMDDPFDAEVNIGQALAKMNQGVGGIHTRAGDMKELISVLNCSSFCSASGLANLACTSQQFCKSSTLCHSIQSGIFPYGVTEVLTSYQNFPTYSWTVQALTHEMGHNLGAPHTHACMWGANEDDVIDDCGNQWAITNGYAAEGAGCWNSLNPILPSSGTIMSYCHLPGLGGIDLSLGFGQEVGDHLRSEHATKTCFTSCTSGADCTHANDTLIAGQIITMDQTIRTSGDTLQTELDASVTITNSSNVTWQSKLSVILNKIFTVEANSQLEVSIDDCIN